MKRLLLEFFFSAVRPKLVAAALGGAVAISGGQLMETSLTPVCVEADQ